MLFTDGEKAAMTIIAAIAVAIGGARTESFLIGIIYGVAAIIGFVVGKYLFERLNNGQRKKKVDG
jgi:zinc transporter ZupT